jgi:hypothetical protein
MICFEVKINGKKLSIAGIENEFGALTTILRWVSRDLRDFPEESRSSVTKEELKLTVAGSITHGKNDHENLNWVMREISPGDEICIKILHSSHIDEPQSRERSDPDLVEKAKRDYYQKLRREYEGSKDV